MHVSCHRTGKEKPYCLKPTIRQETGDTGFRALFTHTRARNQLRTLVVFMSARHKLESSQRGPTEKLPAGDGAVGKPVGNLLNY